jgi:hypothetical protein
VRDRGHRLQGCHLTRRSVWHPVSASPIKFFETASSGAAWLSQYVPIGNLASFVEQIEIARKSLR